MDEVDGVDGGVLAGVLEDPVGLAGVVVDTGVGTRQDFLPDIFLEVGEQVACFLRAVGPLGDLFEGDAVYALHVEAESGAVGFMDYDVLYLCPRRYEGQGCEQDKDVLHVCLTVVGLR